MTETQAQGTATSSVVGESGEGGQETASRPHAVARLLYSSPELIASAVAGFAVPAMILLLAGRFYIPWVIAVGLVGAAIAMWANGLEVAPHDDRGWRIYTLLAAVAVIGWFLLNAHWSAQDLYATRDPATYNLAGRWLVDHHSMPIATNPEVFGNPKNGALASAGFGYNGYGLVYAQGNHLLPALLAVTGWLGGSAVLLKTNVLIGALALYAFFGIARRIVGSLFGLVAMLALAASMPMLYVARDTYSEAVTLLFVVGGLSIAWRALHSHRIRDFALAGVVLGASAMARIDSYASMLSVIVLATVVLAAAPVGKRIAAMVRAGSLVLGAALPTYLGYRDVRRLASLYYVDQRSQIDMLRKAGLALAAVGLVLVLVTWYTPYVRRVFAPAPRRVLAAVGAAGVVAAFAFLASRPLWLVERSNKSNALVVTLQKAGGHSVDGARTYAEQTLSWQAWYLGWPLVVLAVVGYAISTYRLVRHGDLRLLPWLAMGLSLTALYLWTPQITPDQMWASRRYVPVVIPGLVLAAVCALQAIYRERRWRGHQWGRPAALAGVAAVVLVPAAITWPMELVRTDPGQLTQAETVCSAVGRHGAVAEIDQPTSVGYQQTIRAYCNVPSLGVVGATANELATMRIAAAQHGRTLYVLAQDPAAIPFTGSVPPPPFAPLISQRWPQTVEKVPQATSVYELDLWLGRVNPDGTVTLLRS